MIHVAQRAAVATGCGWQQSCTVPTLDNKINESQTEMNEPSLEPQLLQAKSISLKEIGSMVWNAEHNNDLLTVSNCGHTVEWCPSKSSDTANRYPPAWVPAITMAQLHSGRFAWDFVVNEMADRQIGIGFMLLWNFGPDWGFFGYLGASPTAWAYDPSTGDVVTAESSVEGNLPTFENRHTGKVRIELDLPRNAEGSAMFSINGVASRPILLPRGSVVLPAACLLKESQKVTIESFARSEETV